MGRVFWGMLMGIGLLILGIAFVGALVSRPSSKRASNETDAIATSRAISVSAPKLWADYHANEVAADNVYKGRPLIVQGQVTSINKGITDEVYVLLSTFNEFEPIHADIRSEYLSEAASLRIGQIITVDCQGGGMILTSPVLRECSIRPNAPPVYNRPEPHQQARLADATATQDNFATPNQIEKSNATSNNVTPPTVVSLAPADYSAEARLNKLQGTVELVLLVDENGEPQNVTVARSLGMGLDESAVEAVKHCKFKPAIDEKTGRTVPAQMSINVQFSLY